MGPRKFEAISLRDNLNNDLRVKCATYLSQKLNMDVELIAVTIVKEGSSELFTINLDGGIDPTDPGIRYPLDSVLDALKDNQSGSTHVEGDATKGLITMKAANTKDIAATFNAMVEHDSSVETTIYSAETTLFGRSLR